MILDTSALMAIAQREPEAEHFGHLIQTEPFEISAGTLLEAEIVIRSRRGEEGLVDLRAILEDARIEIVSVDERQVRIASDAHRRFGRGSGTPAKLNFGDCFSYALAIARDEALLFKGDDFIHTDVRVAAP